MFLVRRNPCGKLEGFSAGIYRRRRLDFARRGVRRKVLRGDARREVLLCDARRFAGLACLDSTAALRRRALAQPGLLTCRPRAMPSASTGTFSVMIEPAATYAPSPTRTGATSAVSLPMKTRLPIFVSCLAIPSKLQVMVPAPMLLSAPIVASPR